VLAVFVGLSTAQWGEARCFIAKQSHETDNIHIRTHPQGDSESKQTGDVSDPLSLPSIRASAQNPRSLVGVLWLLQLLLLLLLLLLLMLFSL
jgi:hypothetical protein